MPTAGQFRSGATTLGTYGYPMHFMKQTPEDMQYDFGWRGGDVAEVVGLALGAGASTASTIATEVLDTINELNRRAGVCDQFSEAMETYRVRNYVYYAYGPGSEVPDPFAIPLQPAPPPPPQPPRRLAGIDDVALFPVPTYPMWAEEG